MSRNSPGGSGFQTDSGGRGSIILLDNETHKSLSSPLTSVLISRPQSPTTDLLLNYFKGISHLI